MTLNPAKDPSCVLAFDWGEESGNTAYDLSGNGNNGTIHGATRTRGILRHAMYSNGNDKYVYVPDSDSLRPDEQISIMVWFKVKYWGNWKRIIDRRKYPNQDLYIELASEYRIYAGLRIEGNREGVASPYNSIQTNKWYHAALIYDGEAVKLYVNGSLVGTNPATGNLTLEEGHKIYILSGKYGTDNLKGYVGSIRIYDEAKSPKFIRESYYYGIKQLAQKIPSKYISSPLKI